MTLGWLQIVRLGLVQMCIGSVVVLMTSTLNRLMVVELALAASVPGLLVALHYAVQLTRPNWGHRSDMRADRTRFILIGMAVLGGGAVLAALAVGVMEGARAHGIALSVLAYALIGFGVGAAGTSLLALLATATAPARRPAAAMITWLMMIFGIAATAGTVGALLDPYSPARLFWIVAAVAVLAFVLSLVAVRGIEARVTRHQALPPPVAFGAAMAEVWAEPRARNFTLFVFLSMTAYFMQELILEPFAGLVFEFTPGRSTRLSGVQNGGVFLGMLLTGIAATWLRIGSLRGWVVAGCAGSAASLGLIALAGQGQGVPLEPAVAALGLFNGMFAVAAIGTMMMLAGEGRRAREGTRMGLWGAAQAIAAGFGGLLGAVLVDVLRPFLTDARAFGTVFLVEAALFVASALLAARVLSPGRAAAAPVTIAGEGHGL